MLLTPKYYELDLPVIDEDTPVLNVHDNCFDSDEYYAETGNTTFIRNVVIGTYGNRESLKKILEIADKELLAIAKLCGTLALGHMWALQEKRDPQERRRWALGAARDIVPPGKILIAEVDLICNLKKKEDMPPYFLNRIRSGIKQYSGSLSRDEVDIWQFGVGQNVNQSVAQEAAWHLDIEPMMVL
jgi:hypothetical protein